MAATKRSVHAGSPSGAVRGVAGGGGSAGEPGAGPATQRASASAKSRGRTGFAMKSSIPASRQVARSPAIALAVRATMGILEMPPSDDRIALVASRPPISGIRRSMNTID